MFYVNNMLLLEFHRAWSCSTDLLLTGQLFRVCFGQNSSVSRTQMKGDFKFSSVTRTFGVFALKSLDTGIQICDSEVMLSLASGDGQWLSSPPLEPVAFLDLLKFILKHRAMAYIIIDSAYMHVYMCAYTYMHMCMCTCAHLYAYMHTRSSSEPSIIYVIKIIIAFLVSLLHIFLAYACHYKSKSESCN